MKRILHLDINLNLKLNNDKTILFSKLETRNKI